MEKTPIFHDEFKKKVSEGCDAIKAALSDALLTDEGRLDTEKIGDAARDAAKKVEDTVREGHQKFSEDFLRDDGSLNREKLRDAADRTYRKAGRFLATGMSRVAEKLSDKFGTDAECVEVIDSQLVTED